MSNVVLILNKLRCTHDIKMYLSIELSCITQQVSRHAFSQLKYIQV